MWEWIADLAETGHERDIRIRRIRVDGVGRRGWCTPYYYGVQVD